MHEVAGEVSTGGAPTGRVPALLIWLPGVSEKLLVSMSETSYAEGNQSQRKMTSQRKSVLVKLFVIEN